ncbi:hypothetical protein [Roseomonas sp. USHLN139]|uniref:hypothetical protein n=1 Tax=Roseomonas sp. USHLN139 TaxID=3081298 RepID=UPI003B023597
MSNSKILSFGLSVLLLAGPAFAQESAGTSENPTRLSIAVSRGEAGAGAPGNSRSAKGDPLSVPMETSERTLPPLEESMALTNNAPSSDANQLSYDGHPWSHHLSELQIRPDVSSQVSAGSLGG